MNRAKVFVSYSHKDKASVDEFMRYLRPLEARDVLDVWVDSRRLEAGDRFDDEIRQAIDEAKLAVFVISQDLVNSNYVATKEIPWALEAENRGLKVTCLHLGKSNVDIVQHGLMERHALNDPVTELVCLRSDGTARGDPAERDAIYNQAARRVLAHFPSDDRSSARRRRRLDVALTLDGDQVERDYFIGGRSYNRHLLARSTYDSVLADWRRNGLTGLKDNGFGDRLFELLFGRDADGHIRALLKVVFLDEPGDGFEPTYAPVRVRIRTDDVSLRSLPWMHTAWKRQRLYESAGWTFEFAASTAPLTPATLRMPVTMLVAAAPSSETTERTLDIHARALLETASSAATESEIVRLSPDDGRSYFSSAREVDDTVQRRRPQVFYWHGPEADLERLSEAWKDGPPGIVFLNFVGVSGDRMQHVATELSNTVPLVVAQSVDDHHADDARRSAVEFFFELLRAGDDAEPIRVLHEHGLIGAMAWTSHDVWTIQRDASPDPDLLVSRLLDRTTQKATASSVLRELRRSDTRRAAALMCIGTPENHPDEFPDQIESHLRRDHRSDTALRCERVNLPESESFSADDVMQTLRGPRGLNLGYGESFKDAFDRLRPECVEGQRPVILLDWGVRGGRQGSSLVTGAIKAWSAAGADLALHVPDGLRVVSVLTYEVSEGSRIEMQRALETLEKTPDLARREFLFRVLPALGTVEHKDLSAYLDGANSTCPPEYHAPMPSLILAETGGEFATTRYLIEQAERVGRVGWEALHDRLSTRHKSSSPPTLDENRKW